MKEIQISVKIPEGSEIVSDKKEPKQKINYEEICSDLLNEVYIKDLIDLKDWDRYEEVSKKLFEEITTKE